MRIPVKIATPSGGIVATHWVGWHVLEQDRALEEQQIRQRVEHAADIVTAALQRTVAASERRLAEGNNGRPISGSGDRQVALMWCGNRGVSGISSRIRVAPRYRSGNLHRNFPSIRVNPNVEAPYPGMARHRTPQSR